jgi:aryl-alcohol dehydrogenase-like predicted oxidoreductase
MWAWQFCKYQEAARTNGWTEFVSMQDEVSLVYREEEREMLPLCRADSIGVLPWSPLGGGKLTRPWGMKTDRSTTDRYNKSMYDVDADADQGIIQAVAEVAEARSVGMAQVALAWLLQKPGITAPIVGASKLSHVQDALAAATLELSDEEIARLEAPYRPHDQRGFT